MLNSRGRMRRGRLNCSKAFRKSSPFDPSVFASSATCNVQRGEVELAQGDRRKTLATIRKALAQGTIRNDVSLAAFETLEPCARKAGADPDLSTLEREQACAGLVDEALGQLADSIRDGFSERSRQKPLKDCESLRSEPRFQELVPSSRLGPRKPAGASCRPWKPATEDVPTRGSCSEPKQSYLWASSPALGWLQRKIMKRLIFAASTLGLALVLGTSASTTSPAPAFAYHHGVVPAATDDPVPVECPFCGGDATLHVRRMNAIALTTSRIAYQVLDATLF